MDYSIRIRYLGSGKPDKETGRLEELEREINKLVDAGEQVKSITPCTAMASTRLSGVRPMNVFAVITEVEVKEQ